MAHDPMTKPFPADVLSRFPRLRDAYFSFDPRSLGLTRIGLACLLLYDLLRRISGLETWYTNDGLLPNHTVLWRPNSQWLFSIFYTASWAHEVAFWFVLCGLVYLGLLVGWHTRWCHALSLLCVVSLHTRVVFLENGGDVALNLLCAWTLFLPMGARFSVDAVRDSLKRRREQTVAELNDRAFPAQEPVVSLAVPAILLQLAVIYYFNALTKRGITWRTGTAVHYVLHQERMATWLAWKVRHLVTPRMSQFATYFTLGVEALAPVLLLTPLYRKTARRIAVVLIPMLHLSFALLLNVGMFSFNMIGYFPLLLAAADWTKLARIFGPRPTRARVVYVDADSPLCFAWARLLSRLDTFGLLQFAPISEASQPNDGHQVRAAASAAVSSGYRAVAECVAALPFGSLVAAVMRLPGVHGLGRRLHDTMTKHRVALSTHPLLGFAPVGVAANVDDARSARQKWLARPLAYARESAVLLLMIALGSQVLMENKIVPTFLKLGQAEWMKQVVAYPRLFQGWSMFTPDAPMGERMVYVDAITTDGRHVDPYNEAGSRVAELPVTRIPPFMDQDEFWCDYTNRIPENGAYFGPLRDWIFKYHVRTGRPEDRIKSFEVHLIESDSPPPGEVGARNIRTRSLMRETQ